MRYIELIYRGQVLTEWSRWEAAELNIVRDAERLNVEASIDNIVLIDQAKQIIQQALQANQYKPLPVRLRLGGITWEALIDTAKTRFAPDRIIISITIDELATFERAVMGRRPTRVAQVEVALEREADIATLAALLVSAMLLLYTIIKEARDIATDAANLAAHIAGGASGSAAGAVFAAVMIVIRTAFVVALTAAFISILDELIKLLPTKKTTKAINLYEAIEDVCQAAGYSVALPSDLRKVWLVGDYVDSYEATELLRLAATILNQRFYIQNRTLRSSAMYMNFPLANIAYTEVYRLNLEDFSGRTIVSLTRDFSDRFTNNLPHAAEIAYQGFMGLDRKTISESPAKVKTETTPLDRLTGVVNDVLSTAQRFVRRIRVPDPPGPGLVLVGSEYFNTKIIFADSVTNLSQNNETALLDFIANNYQRRLMRVYENVRIPFTEATYAQLAQLGFPGVRRLRWAINSDYAEVDFEVTEPTQPVKTTYIV